MPLNAMGEVRPSPQSSDQTPVVRAVGLSRGSPGRPPALDTVSLAVRAGEIYCLVGAAGAGKTLVLHLCVGLATPTAGQAFLADVDVTREPVAARRHATYVPRGAVLHASLTARENVEFFTQADGGRAGLRRSDCYDAMRRASIPERDFERPAHALGQAASVGVWLAISLLRNAPVLLFDDPTSGLDLSATTGLQEALERLRAQGKAILVATSDVLFAGGVADRVGILQEGRKRIELDRRDFIVRSLPELYLDYAGRPLVAPSRSGQPARLPSS